MHCKQGRANRGAQGTDILEHPVSPTALGEFRPPLLIHTSPPLTGACHSHPAKRQEVSVAICSFLYLLAPESGELSNDVVSGQLSCSWSRVSR